MRISKGRILAASIIVAAIAVIMPVSLLSSFGVADFQTATGATSATITVTVSLAPLSAVTISGNTSTSALLTYGTGADTSFWSNGSGDYEFVVPYHWTGTLTPTKTGVTFTPSHLHFDSVEVDQVNQDFNPSLILNVEQDGDHAIPKEYMLAQNYPNPFNPSTVIRFALPRAGFASLKVYNIVGQEVTNLVSGILPAGAFRVTWGGTDMNGQAVSSGVYFYRLQAGDYIEIRKMLLLK
jgi:hypothetical protein